jgi:hypothetical protein
MQAIRLNTGLRRLAHPYMINVPISAVRGFSLSQWYALRCYQPVIINPQDISSRMNGHLAGD